jgi:cell shape-determining protein MreD
MLTEAAYQLKSALNALLPFTADALHVHVGLFLFLVVAALVRNDSRRYAIAFLVVLAVCLANEVFDVLHDLSAGNRVRWRNGIKDTVNTMLWPTVWAVIGTQSRRRRAAKGPEPAPTEHAPLDLSRMPK